MFLHRRYRLIEQEEVAAALEANARGLRLTVPRVDYTLAIDVDMVILGSAPANLLQNAIKFSPPSGNVTLRGRAAGEPFPELDAPIAA